MKTKLIRLVLLALAIALCTIGGTSCRTMRGLGQDVQSAGHHLEHEANEHQ